MAYNQPAAQYLSEIPAPLWVAAHFPGRRYGQDTSNIVERVNAAFKTEREYSVINLLSALWHKTMTTRYQRQQDAQKYTYAFTSIAIKELQKHQMSARMHQVEMASSIEGRVIEGRQLKVQHYVNLHYRTCTCRVYQEMGIPCEHALACILQLGQSPQQYLPEDLSTEVWQSTYSDNLHPVIYPLRTNDNTKVDKTEVDKTEVDKTEVDIQAPLTRVPRGRPRKERVRRGTRGPYPAPNNIQQTNPQQRCSTCQQPGHKARTCRVPHF